MRLLDDEDSWAIRYLVLSTSKGWLGHEVLLASQGVKRMSWDHETVAVEPTRGAPKPAPQDEPALSLTCETEIAVYRQHGRAL